MQGIPVTEGVITSSMPSLIPGPFILLLALPAIPLLLFSIGARPPDTSNLPFSTDDLWQTTAIITIAGAVVLCLCFWPDAFSEIGQWISNGGIDEVGHGGDDRGVLLRFGRTAFSKVFMDHDGQGEPSLRRISSWPEGSTSRQEQQRVWRQRSNGIDPYSDLRKFRDTGNYQHSSGRSLRFAASGQRFCSSHLMSSRSLLVSLGSIAQDPSLPVRHLKSLREGSLASWYSPRPPSLFTGLLMSFLTIFIVYHLAKKLIGDGYDSEPKSNTSNTSQSGQPSSHNDSEAWLQRELRKREQEKGDPQVTEKRVKEERQKWEESLESKPDMARSKEMKARGREEQQLRSQLQKRGLPLVGFSGTSKSKKDKKEEGKRDDGNRKEKERNTHVEEKRGERKSFGSKLKRAFLGRQLSDSVNRLDSNEDHRKTQSRETKIPLAGGPGWRPADEAVAQAALAGGEARAEALGNRMTVASSR